MSDDLISRKALLSRLEKQKNRSAILEEQFWFDGVMAIVDTQPTAFDKEKVMAKLRSEYMDASNMYFRLRGTAHSYSSEVRKDAWEKAVEVVEKGGIE